MSPAKKKDPKKDSRPTAADYLPASSEPTLDQLREAIAGCQGCEIHQSATQPVFGEGTVEAKLIIVGEQPGDREDRAGKPFVGPAGRLLDQTLATVGIPREAAYVTNVVKHFKWTPRGKRRLHAKPSPHEIRACKPWLEAEITAVGAPLLVMLGATAGQSLMGSSFRVTKSRRQALESRWARWAFATLHPAALLRIPDRADRELAEEEFVEDFRLIARYYAELAELPEPDLAGGDLARKQPAQ